MKEVGGFKRAEKGSTNGEKNVRYAILLFDIDSRLIVCCKIFGNYSAG